MTKFLMDPKGRQRHLFFKNFSGIGLFYNIHMSAVSIFGIVFWATINHFDRHTPGCNAITVQSILFREYSVFSCKKAWLIVYSIFAIPIFNLSLLYIVF